MRLFLIRAVAGLAALLSASAAFGQCGTTLPGGTLCGNRTGSSGLNGPLTNPVLGIPGTVGGQIGFAGSGSGTATLKAQAAAGTPTLQLPTVSGILTVGGSGSFAGTSPITVSFPAGVVTYAFDFTVANTFLAQQTAQGATTTSPGWYAQIAGDTVPRVRVGMNATDIPSIAFGPGNANRDTFLERVSAGVLRFGAPDVASPVAQTSIVQNVVAGTSNTAGANRTIAGSQGTGTGAGGSIIFQTAPAGTTGTAQNALINTAVLASGGPLTLTPASGTPNQGLVITQTLPVGTTSAGPYNANYESITNGGYTSTASGISTTFGLLNALSAGHRIDFLSAGTGAGTGPIQLGFMVAASATSRGQQLVGAHFSAAHNSNSAGQDYIWAQENLAYLGPSANVAGSFVADFQSAIRSGATVTNRSGINIISIADGSPSGLDTAIAIQALANPYPAGGATVPFKDVITLWTNSGPQPYTGSFVTADSPLTVTNFINLPNMTVTGKIFDFGSGVFQVSNIGGITTGGNFTLTLNGNSSTGLFLTNTSAGTGGASVTQYTNNIGAGAMGFAGSGFSTAIFANRMFVNAPSASAGIVINNAGANPTVFGTSSSQVAQIQLGLQVGTTSRDATGVINAGIGFNIAGAATSGNVLRGNGTNFVSAQLSCADLSTPCITGNSTLTFGTHLSASGTSYNGSAPVTIQSDATAANTASTIMLRDGSGQVAATTFTGALTGHASLDLALTGGTMSGAIAMGTNAITGLTTLACAGACTFQSNGSTLAATISTGQNWGFGTETNPQARVVISNNVTTGIVGYSASNYSAPLRVIAADGKNTSVEVNAFAQNPRILGTRADNTAASPAVIAGADELLFNFAGGGYDGSAAGYYVGGAWLIWSTQAFTNGAHGGTYMTAYTTPNNTQSIAEAMRIQASGGVSIGGTTDPLIGGLYLNGQQFMPNITTSSAAQTGTVCWTTGTGKFTVDTTVGCLTSLLAAKNITERLTSAKALDIVDRLSPFAFRYKNGWGDSGHYEQFGLGAEEVAQVDERLVGRDPDGKLQGVRYQELTAVLAGAIQELKADNDNLHAEVNSLKSARK